MGADSPCSVRIAVTGEVDMSTGPDLQSRILAGIHRGGPDVIIDLSQVLFLGAAGLSVLVAANKHAGASGVGLSVVACSRATLRPLTVTAVATVLDLHPDLQHVLDAQLRSSRGVLGAASRSGMERP